MSPSRKDTDAPNFTHREMLGRGHTPVLTTVGILLGLATYWALTIAPFRMVEPDYPRYAHVAAALLALIVAYFGGFSIGSALIILLFIARGVYKRSLIITGGEIAALSLGFVMIIVGALLLRLNGATVASIFILFMGTLTLVVTFYFRWFQSRYIELIMAQQCSEPNNASENIGANAPNSQR